MFTAADKAWVAAVVTWVGHLLATKLGLAAFISPELLAVVTGAVTYWMPNRAAPVAPAPPQPK